MKANQEIRELLESNNISYWQIAVQLKIHESTFIRHMRIELPDEEKTKVIEAIAKITKE